MAPVDLELDLRFAKAARFFPALTANSSPLGFGGLGLVIDHHDGTVSKICFANDLLEPHALDVVLCRDKEVEALKLLNGQRFDSVRTPQLVEEPVTLEDDDEDYIGYYRMTKMEGQIAGWCNLLNNGTPNERKNYFHQIGRLAAQFHAFTKEKTSVSTLRHKAALLPDHDEFYDETKEMISSANHYLTAHKQSAVIHGDLRQHNMMSDEKGRLTSLYDFSLFGQSDNYLSEFKWVMEHCGIAMPYITEGYEDASGDKIDGTALYLVDFRRHMICMMNSCFASPHTRVERVAYLNEKIQNALRPVHCQVLSYS